MAHKVYLKDSREMSEVLDGTVDLVLFDPPLWNHVRYSNDEGQLGNELTLDGYMAGVRQTAGECVRTMTDGGVLLTTVPDVFVMKGGAISDTVAFHHELYAVLRQLGLRLVSTVTVLVGDEKVREFVPGDENPSRSRDDMRTARTIMLQAFVKGECPDYLRSKTTLDYWQNVKRFGSHSTILGSRWLYRVVTRFLSWPFLRNLVQAIRPARKTDKSIDYPVRASYEMFDWAIQSWSKPNDIVLDPFLGTGTSLKICKKTGRRCVGYEINPGAYPAIVKSLGDISDIEFIGWDNPDIQ